MEKLREEESRVPVQKSPGVEASKNFLAAALFWQAGVGAIGAGIYKAFSKESVSFTRRFFELLKDPARLVGSVVGGSMLAVYKYKEVKKENDALNASKVNGSSRVVGRLDLDALSDNDKPNGSRQLGEADGGHHAAKIKSEATDRYVGR